MSSPTLSCIVLLFSAALAGDPSVQVLHWQSEGVTALLRAQQPFVLMGGTNFVIPPISDVEQWSAAALLRRHGDTPVALGSNASLSSHGVPSMHRPVPLRTYLSGSEQGYLFLTGNTQRQHRQQPSSPLLEDARATTRRWWRAGLRAVLGGGGGGDWQPQLPQQQQWEHWEPVLAIGACGGDPGGIPFHRHYSAWFLLLHGRKQWYLYPPSSTPPNTSTTSKDGNAVSGPSEWVDRVLPRLPLAKHPQEVLQQPGQVVYIPEGWWHATQNEHCDPNGEVAIGLGGQASTPISQGPLELAQNVAPLMESGKFEDALELTRATRTRSRGVDSPQLAQLHGDIITAILSREEQRKVRLFRLVHCVNLQPSRTVVRHCVL
eukprot:COSAG05_NODE_243_length_13035_cov_115.270022_8_plen_376_part_00